jgi:hypothetical protein
MSILKYKDPLTGEWVVLPTKGDAGKHGKSAYEFAKEAGYDGTE